MEVLTNPLVVGALAGTVIACIICFFAYRAIDRKVDAKMAEWNREKREAEEKRKARDTEKNIGNRFANLVRKTLDDRRFLIDVRFADTRGSGYFINVYPKYGGDRLFTMTVCLDYVDDSVICGSMGLGNQYKSTLHASNVDKLYGEVKSYLETL